MKCNCKQHEACKVIWQAKWHHFCVVTIICHTPNLWMSRVALLMLVACSFQAHNNKWPTFLLLILLNLCVVSHWWWIINFPNFPKNRRCTQICSRIQSLCFFKSFLAMYLPQNFDECFSCEFFFFMEIYAYTNTVFQSYQYIDHITKRVDMHVAGASLFI